MKEALIVLDTYTEVVIKRNGRLLVDVVPTLLAPKQLAKYKNK